MAIIIHPNGKGYKVRYYYPAFLRITTSGGTVKQIPVRELRVLGKGSDGVMLNPELNSLLKDGERLQKIETIDSYGKVLDEYIMSDATLVIPEE